jgi:hypothetical protein
MGFVDQFVVDCVLMCLGFIMSLESEARESNLLYCLLVFDLKLRLDKMYLLLNSRCGCASVRAWPAVQGRLGTRGCATPAVGGHISCEPL